MSSRRRSAASTPFTHCQPAIDSRPGCKPTLPSAVPFTGLLVQRISFGVGSRPYYSDPTRQRLTDYFPFYNRPRPGPSGAHTRACGVCTRCYPHPVVGAGCNRFLRPPPAFWKKGEKR